MKQSRRGIASLHMSLKLERASDVPLRVRFYDLELDSIISILSDLCELAQSRQGVFRVGGFGQAQWPVDVRTDLCVVLEQLPRLLRAVKSGSPAVLDFYEQSIRRRLTFAPLRKDYEVTCVPFSPYWEPSPATERIGRVALERMLAAVLDEFMKFLRRVAPQLERHAWIRAWLA